MSVTVTQTVRGHDIMSFDSLLREFEHAGKLSIMYVSSYQAGNAQPATTYVFEIFKPEHYTEFGKRWEASRKIYVEIYSKPWNKLVRKIKALFRCR